MTSRLAPSTRQASRKTADAADQLLSWLKQQGGLPDGAGDGQPEPGQPTVGSVAAPGFDPSMPPIPEDTSRGFGKVPGQEHNVGQSLIRRAERAPRKSLCSPKHFVSAAGFADDAARAPLRPRHTDWLQHRLLVAGLAGTLAGFQAAACGSGTIP